LSLSLILLLLILLLLILIHLFVLRLFHLFVMHSSLPCIHPSITIPFYTGAGFLNVVTWAGTFVNGFVNFVFPLYLYILAVRKYGSVEAATDSPATAPASGM
jgi:hypothetical protein